MPNLVRDLDARARRKSRTRFRNLRGTWFGALLLRERPDQAVADDPSNRVPQTARNLVRGAIPPGASRAGGSRRPRRCRRTRPTGSSCAQLAAQARGVRVERARAADDHVAPHLAQQLRLGEDALRLAREPQEELVLLLRELHAAARDPHLARSRVDPDGRRVDHRAHRRPHAAQHGVDPLDELLVLERRRDVVVAARAGTRARGRRRRPRPGRARSPARGRASGRRRRRRRRGRGRAACRP